MSHDENYETVADLKRDSVCTSNCYDTHNLILKQQRDKMYIKIHLINHFSILMINKRVFTNKMY